MNQPKFKIGQVVKIDSTNLPISVRSSQPPEYWEQPLTIISIGDNGIGNVLYTMDIKDSDGEYRRVADSLLVEIEEAKMVSLVVLANTSEGGETATAMCDHIGSYVEGQEGITVDQLVTLCSIYSGTDELTVRSKIEGQTPEELYEYLVDDIGAYDLDELVVVDEDKLPEIEEMSNEALDHGSDSAWYRACEMYNRYVRKVGVKHFSLFGDGSIVSQPK